MPTGSVYLPRPSPAVHDPWQILSYLTVGVLVGIIVSLFTRKTSEDKLDRFYNLTKTPIQEGEVIDEPCQLPPGSEGVAAERKMLIQCCGLEVPMPSRTAWIGFGLGWAGVAILIGGFILLIRI